VKFNNHTNLITFYKKLKHSFLTINSSTLNNLIQDAEQHYLDIYYLSHNRSSGIAKLKQINKRKQITQKETFYFGFFVGFSFILFIVILVLMFEKGPNKSFIMSDPDFISIFPIFRGILLIILYSVLFG
jgi:membrane-associated HD superfamily phosphohydrolase